MKIKEWLADHYAMFHEGHLCRTLYLNELGDREVESADEAWLTVNARIDLLMLFLDGIRPINPMTAEKGRRLL